jgi:uncharacterized protein YjbJ (UPF0337 family)
MSWNKVEGNWNQFKGKVKEKWGELTDDELDQIAGKRDILIGKIQEKYGIVEDEAEKRIKEFEKELSWSLVLWLRSEWSRAARQASGTFWFSLFNGSTNMRLGTILLIVLILLLVGVLPTWPHSMNWGYAPSGGLGLVLIIVLILFLMGRI